MRRFSLHITSTDRDRVQRERERIFKGTNAPNGRWLAHQPNYPGPQSAKPRPTCALVHSRHTQEFSKHGSIMQACASACLNAGKENDNLYVCCGRQGNGKTSKAKITLHRDSPVEHAGLWTRRHWLQGSACRDKGEHERSPTAITTAKVYTPLIMIDAHHERSRATLQSELCSCNQSKSVPHAARPNPNLGACAGE